ncbi:MAG TPA: PAS domain S-box protein [Thermoanaerobaculia bacterium]|nr:PAS domain S-box protein [Thermoanaerobaculia bacterium]
MTAGRARGAAAAPRGELEERVQLQSQLLEAVGQALVATDPEGRVTFWNRAAERLYGWSREEALGRPLIGLTVPEEAQDQAAEILARSRAGESWTGELVVQRRDGMRFPALITSSPILGASGEAIGVVGVFRDISERRGIEVALQRRTRELAVRVQELRESEARFRAIFAGAGIGVAVADAEGRLVEANRSLLELLGYRPDELRGRRFTEITYPEDLEPELERFAEMTRGERDGYQMEKRYVRRDGSLVWGRLTVSAIRADPGQPAEYLVGMVEDITTRKRAEEALRESERRYRSLVDLSPDGVFVYRNGTIVFANDAGAQLVGRESASEVVGRAMTDFVHPETRHQIEARVRERRGGGEVRQLIDSYLRPDGTRMFFEVSSAPIDYEGQPGRLVVVRDATRRVGMEKQLRRSREELRQLATRLQSVREEEQARIAREIHDELGQMLTALKLDVSWLRRRMAEIGCEKWEGPIEARVTEMGGLLDQTLDSVRRLALELRPVVLDDLGLEAAVEWQVEEFARRTGVPADCDCDLAGARPEAQQATALYRILQEALTNVARHAAARRVRVTLTPVDGNLRLEVADDGGGLPVAGVEEAPSLGLLSMRERARASGGSLVIDSAPGGGTRVIAEIPVKPPRQHARRTRRDANPDRR